MGSPNDCWVSRQGDAYTAMMLRMSIARITGHGGGEGGPSERVSAADEGALAAAVRRWQW
jgi:hypothetical protein